MLEAVEYVTGDSLVEFLEEVVGGDLVLDDQQMHKWLREKLRDLTGGRWRPSPDRQRP
jgi:hypothetical protein